MNSEHLSTLRRRFRPSEISILAGSAMGRTLRASNFADRVRNDLVSGGIFGAMVQRTNVHPDLLLHKLERLSEEQLETLTEALLDWSHLPNHEAMGPNGLPSISTLQRLGLVEPPKGRVCWGLLICRREIQYDEFLIYRPELIPEVENEPVEDLALELVEKLRAGEPLNDQAIWDCVYRIHRATGWRRILVEVAEDPLRISEISIGGLLEAIYEGNLSGVGIEGVNAPYQVRPGVDF